MVVFARISNGQKQFVFLLCCASFSVCQGFVCERTLLKQILGGKEKKCSSQGLGFQAPFVL